MAIDLYIPAPLTIMPSAATEASQANCVKCRYKTREIKRVFNSAVKLETINTGSFEKILNFIQQKIKIKARPGIFNVMTKTAEEKTACNPALLFLRLRNKARPIDQPRFNCKIEKVYRRNIGLLYSCSLSIGNKEIYSFSAPRADENVALFHALQVCLEALKLFALYSHEFTLDNLIKASTQAMSDDTTLQERLFKEKDKTLFCRANLRGIKINGDNRDQLLVNFGDQTLILSNRCATNLEFRACRLRHALLERQYGTLRDLIAPDHLTHRDGMLVYAMMAAQEPLTSFLGGTPLQDPSAPLSNDIRLLLHGVAIGNTTLGKCLSIPNPDAGANVIATGSGKEAAGGLS